MAPQLPYFAFVKRNMQTTEITQESYLKTKAENDLLKQEIEGLKMYFQEIEATNNHLISATWRERDMKKKLAETIEELNQTKKIVENQNQRITESINYSKKIQQAINPTENDLRKQYAESFILYQPKDVISGDFPWLFTLGNYTYVAAVDCTGHGVPGAMMSMIGSLLLKDVASCNQVLMPSMILRKLHESVVETLKQDSSASNSNDGMDLAMCCIDNKNKQLFFSGAHRPLFFQRSGEITVYSGNKFPIGGMHYKGKNSFTDQVIDFKEGDSVFLFTDGLPDQTGGPEKKKLMSKNVKTFFEERSEKKFSELKNNLVEYLSEWKGNNKQVDDILTIGIKF
ncbi:MAG: pas/pac sensor protein [Bacteroidetes bacterium]|jgi:serine phosphatase RsbU (regulator of sigma subunit)|nr:pas/pac sensor protein [Bacteroidota bacterium]